MTPMTRDEVIALPVAVDLPTAGRAWGMSRSVVHARNAAGELPFPVVKIGHRWMVTREALLTSLGIDPRLISNSTNHTAPSMSEAGPLSPATATATPGREAPSDGKSLRAV